MLKKEERNYLVIELNNSTAAFICFWDKCSLQKFSHLITFLGLKFEREF